MPAVWMISKHLTKLLVTIFVFALTIPIQQWVITSFHWEVARLREETLLVLLLKSKPTSQLAVDTQPLSVSTHKGRCLREQNTSCGWRDIVTVHKLYPAVKRLASSYQGCGPKWTSKTVFQVQNFFFLIKHEEAAVSLMCQAVLLWRKLNMFQKRHLRTLSEGEMRIYLYSSRWKIHWQFILFKSDFSYSKPTWVTQPCSTLSYSAYTTLSFANKTKYQTEKSVRFPCSSCSEV